MTEQPDGQTYPLSPAADKPTRPEPTPTEKAIASRIKYAGPNIPVVPQDGPDQPAAPPKSAWRTVRAFLRRPASVYAMCVLTSAVVPIAGMLTGFDILCFLFWAPGVGCAFFTLAGWAKLGLFFGPLVYYVWFWLPLYFYLRNGHKYLRNLQVQLVVAQIFAGLIVWMVWTAWSR